MKRPNKLLSLEYLFYDFVKLTSALPGLLLYRPKRLYESELARKRIRGGALLIGNHTGYFDPIYLQFCVWYRRHHFLCLKEFLEGKAAFFFRHFLCIPIDRENFSLDSFREITERLSRGELISMFPEGKINAEGGIASFKSGMVLMALRSGKPIIPVYVARRTHALARLRIAVGEPVDVAARLGEHPALSEIDAMTSYLQEKEQQLCALCEGR